jgi:hypothetical protein
LEGFEVERWKLVASAVISLSGAVLLAMGIPIPDLSGEWDGLAIVGGFAVIMLGILFGGVTIRCPACRARLLLREAPPNLRTINLQYWRDLGRLTTTTRCPRCVDDQRTNRERATTGDLSERHPVAVFGRLVFGAWDLFMSTGLLAITAIVVKLGLYSPLVGGILVATVVGMGAVVVIWRQRTNS